MGTLLEGLDRLFAYMARISLNIYHSKKNVSNKSCKKTKFEFLCPINFLGKSYSFQIIKQQGHIGTFPHFHIKPCSGLMDTCGNYRTVNNSFLARINKWSFLLIKFVKHVPVLITTG